MDNSFKYTCLVLNTFVNIYILYVIMQLILLSSDLCCVHVLHVPFTRDLPSPLVDCGVIINAKEDLYEINFVKKYNLCWFVSGLSTGRKCQRKHGTKRLPSCIPARGLLTGAASLPLC